MSLLVAVNLRAPLLLGIAESTPERVMLGASALKHLARAAVLDGPGEAAAAEASRGGAGIVSMVSIWNELAQIGPES